MYPLLFLIFVRTSFCRSTSVTSAFTDPTQWPGYAVQRVCGSEVFSSLGDLVGCPNWPCVCNHFYLAQSTASSLAKALCSGNKQDIQAVSSIIDGFCHQLPSVTMHIPFPTVPVTATPAKHHFSRGGTITRFETQSSWGLSGLTYWLDLPLWPLPRQVTNLSHQLLQFLHSVISPCLVDLTLAVNSASSGTFFPVLMTCMPSVKIIAGLTRNDKIALGVGIGLGVPICLALLFFCFKSGSKKLVDSLRHQNANASKKDAQNQYDEGNYTDTGGRTRYSMRTPNNGPATGHV